MFFPDVGLFICVFSCKIDLKSQFFQVLSLTCEGESKFYLKRFRNIQLQIKYKNFCSVFLFMKYTFLRMMGYENRMFQTNTKVVFHLLPRVAHFISVKCLLKFLFNYTYS